MDNVSIVRRFQQDFRRQFGESSGILEFYKFTPGAAVQKNELAAPADFIVFHKRDKETGVNTLYLQVMDSPEISAVLEKSDHIAFKNLKSAKNDVYYQLQKDTQTPVVAGYWKIPINLVGDEDAPTDEI